MAFSKRKLENDMVPFFQSIRLMNESVVPEILADASNLESHET